MGLSILKKKTPPKNKNPKKGVTAIKDSTGGHPGDCFSNMALKACDADNLKHKCSEAMTGKKVNE